MSTKEEVLAAVAKRFRTKEVDVGDGVKVTLRELNQVENAALDARMFETEANGELKRDDKDQAIPRKDVDFIEEQLAATMVPAFTVKELFGPEWPTSLKAELYKESLAVNRTSLKDAVGNS